MVQKKKCLESSDRIYSSYQTNIELENDDIVSVIQSLSEKYALQYISYSSMSYSEDSYSGNGNFSMYQIRSVSQLIQALRNGSVLDATAVFMEKGIMEDSSNELCLLLRRPGSVRFSIVYDFIEGKKDSRLFDEFEKDCMDILCARFGNRQNSGQSTEEDRRKKNRVFTCNRIISNLPERM